MRAKQKRFALCAPASAALVIPDAGGQAATASPAFDAVAPMALMPVLNPQAEPSNMIA